jgi:gas vesicle protein
MPSKSEMTPRDFNPMAPELSDEARKAVKAAFDAMSTWQKEIVGNSEKNLERVIDKVAVAAQALGWPEEIADTVRTQMRAINNMQSQMMDQMMTAWEEQMKSPSPPSAMLSKLRYLPTVPAGGWPGAASQMANPLEAYMQMAQQWQKVWLDAVAPWMKAGDRN